MKISEPTETIDEEELTELVTTNKCLAMEKRDFHRQKLRAYSQKTVKLRAMLRETTDAQEKKCLEAKLKNLQKKQDLQITKLARIDQIERQLDEFITEENEDCQEQQNKKLSQYKNNLNQINSIQDTPAQRLRTKSSMPYNYRHDQQREESAFSKTKTSFSKNKDNEQLLLKHSRQALEDITCNKVTMKSYNNSRKSVKQKKQINVHYNYNGRFEPEKINPVKLQWNAEQNTQPNVVTFDGVPALFTEFVDKVNKFWPNDIQNLIKYFKESEKTREKYEQQQLRLKALNKREQKIRQNQARLKNQDQRINKMQQKIQQFIQKERRLMENIDKLQKQETAIERQIQVCLSAIVNASKHISNSSFSLGESNDPIKVDCFLSESIHKFSIDSFQSFREGTVLSTDLAKFEKGMQQYLMSAERAVMIVSGEFQQVQAKLSKAKEEATHLQARKKFLETQVTKVDHGLNKRKSLLKDLEEEIVKFQEEAAEIGATLDIKKSLAQQLQDKCEKLRLKKKSFVERVKILQEEVSSLTLRKQQLFEGVIQIQQQMASLKAYQKQLETKIIFCERDKQNRQKDIQMLQKKAQDIIIRIQESNNANQQLITQISQRQLESAKINEAIKAKMEEQSLMAEKARKLQLQLSQSTNLLEQQIKLAQEQTEKVVEKSAEHLKIQTKISQALSKLRQTEIQMQQNITKINEQKNELQGMRQQLQQMLTAKADLQQILHQVLMKKQLLVVEIQERSKQLQLLLGDLESGQNDYQSLYRKLQEIQSTIQNKQGQIKSKQEQCQDLRVQLDEQLQEENNLISRLTKLKEVERTILIGLGAKGASSYLDEDLKRRVTQAVAELATLNELKAQIKDCKYQNRKLKLQNQRLSKMLEGQ